MTVGQMFIASGGLVSGFAIDNVHQEAAAQKNVRQTIAILADGVLLGRVLCNQHNTGGVARGLGAAFGYDDEHGFTFQLPSELVDGKTTHTITAAGSDVFATVTGVLQ
jgi:hypothetical protein